jgi:ABC-2 type transport system ATP-binding protein
VLARLDGGGWQDGVPEALARVGLSERAEDRVAGYSTGMRQRLALAAALLRSPRLLLLDEPTEGLDPQGITDVLRLIGELAAGGTGVLMSAHRIEEVQAACSRFTVLRTGQVAWTGSAERLHAEAAVTSHRLSTSDDERALQLASSSGVAVKHDDEGGLRLSAPQAARDRYVLALGRAGVAVRSLEPSEGSLAALYARLTAEAS